MDPGSACRLAIRVNAYVEQRPDGLGDYHVTENWIRVVDKDEFNWMGFHQLLAEDIARGQDQELQVTYLDKEKNETVRIDSDSSLLHALDQYWDSRKVPLTVDDVDTYPWDKSAQQSLSVITNPDVCVPLDTISPDIDDDDDEHNDPEPDANDRDEADVEVDDSDASTDPEPEVQDADWGENDEVEYVGVDDEGEKYNDVLNDDKEDDNPVCYPDTDDEEDDPLKVDDQKDCAGLVHVTDIDNPIIAVGVTFEDGFCFKRCIRQYAVLNEYELAVPYSESKRYRAYCKAKRCRWRIHASQCQDGKTWQVFSSSN